MPTGPAPDPGSVSAGGAESVERGAVAAPSGQAGGTVLLLDFPIDLFGAAEWHWRALLREYLLRGLEGHDQPYDMDAINRAGLALDVVSTAIDDVRGADGVGGRVDVVLDISPADALDFAALEGALDDAVRLTRREELLQLTPVPEFAALRTWISAEVTGQAVGAAATPWELPTRLSSDAAAAEWDHGIAPPPTVPWLVGDDQNRIVGASGAALSLLGWEEDELLGQRLLVVIPPALRERHVAAFSRSVLLGEDRLLGQPLPLPALTRTGGEIPITLTLSRHPARRGRTVYLALLEPRIPADSDPA